MSDNANNGVKNADEIFIRERSLIGDEAFQKLKNAKVAVFGLGG